MRISSGKVPCFSDTFGHEAAAVYNRSVFLLLVLV